MGIVRPRHNHPTKKGHWEIDCPACESIFEGTHEWIYGTQRNMDAASRKSAAKGVER